MDHPKWSKINTFSAKLVETIRNLQAEWFVTHGQFFQGVALLGPDARPDGMTDVEVINTSKPTDSEYNWGDFAPGVFRNNLKVPVQLKIDVYQTPTAHGWILRADVWKAGLGPDEIGNEGDHWFFIHNEGPDASPEYNDKWFVMAEE